MCASCLEELGFALRLLDPHVKKIDERVREKSMANSSLRGVCELICWQDKKPEAVSHKMFVKAIECIQELRQDIQRLREAHHKAMCDECGFESAVDWQSEDTRNICPVCMFSFVFPMSVIVSSIKKYGKFPPPLTLDEEFEAAANGFPFAGIHEKAPEEIRDLVKLTLG